MGVIGMSIPIQIGQIVMFLILLSFMILNVWDCEDDNKHGHNFVKYYNEYDENDDGDDDDYDKDDGDDEVEEDKDEVGDDVDEKTSDGKEDLGKMVVGKEGKVEISMFIWLRIIW